MISCQCGFRLQKGSTNPQYNPQQTHYTLYSLLCAYFISPVMHRAVAFPYILSSCCDPEVSLKHSMCFQCAAQFQLCFSFSHTYTDRQADFKVVTEANTSQQHHLAAAAMREVLVFRCTHRHINLPSPRMRCHDGYMHPFLSVT